MVLEALGYDESRLKIKKIIGLNLNEAKKKERTDCILALECPKQVVVGGLILEVEARTNESVTLYDGISIDDAIDKINTLLEHKIEYTMNGHGDVECCISNTAS